MAIETSKTLADIAKELRRQSDEEHASATKLRRTDDDVDFAIASCYAEDAKYLSQIADRIEAVAKRAYNAIDKAVCGIEDASHYDIDGVRMAMEKTIGDYYE